MRFLSPFGMTGWWSEGASTDELPFPFVLPSFRNFGTNLYPSFRQRNRHSDDRRNPKNIGTEKRKTEGASIDEIPLSVRNDGLVVRRCKH